MRIERIVRIKTDFFIRVNPSDPFNQRSITHRLYKTPLVRALFMRPDNCKFIFQGQESGFKIAIAEITKQ
jgi:hypothetical protein